jgi:hypothetical protein
MLPRPGADSLRIADSLKISDDLKITYDLTIVGGLEDYRE